MKYEDFKKTEEMRELFPSYRENDIAIKVLLEYLEKSDKHEFPHQNTGNFIEDLLYNYFLLKENNQEKLLEEILNSYNFNYSMAIHNAIYYLLGKKDELFTCNIKPRLWPGIFDIFKDKNNYTLKTNLGTIEVTRASNLFCNSPSFYIFYKQLMGECYQRAYDFIKENRDFTAVLSYMPNFFSGGHYHAYLEKGTETLDIAANSYYFSKESSDKVLGGEIIKKLSYYEIEEEFNRITTDVKELEGMSKLHVLALYYDKTQ